MSLMRGLLGRNSGELVRLLVRPVLTFCLRHGLRYHQLVEIQKQVFLNLAADEIESRGERVTVSRLSVTTGINRREVTRIYKRGETVDDRQSLASRILGQWEQDPHFLTKSGKPRILSFGDEDSDFTKLVAAVSRDVGPASVLAELERIGAVERTRGGVKLTRTTDQVQYDSLDAFKLLSRDSDAFIRAVEENVVSGDEIRNHHNRTEYDNVFQDAIPEIKSWLFEQGAIFHKKAREFIANFDKDINPQPSRKGGGRVVITSFSWSTEDDK